MIFEWEGAMLARTAIAVAIGLGMAAPWPASADTITLNTVARGHYDGTDFSDPSNYDYIAGQIGTQSQYHDFFTFDLTGITGTITSAILSIRGSGAADTDGFSSETFQAFVYTGNVSTLDAGGATYNDLVSGPLAASGLVDRTPFGTLNDMSLNIGALTALTIGEGGLFAFGGDLAGVPDGNPTSRFVYANAGIAGEPSDGATQLILTGVSIIPVLPVSIDPTPLPAALPLFASGAGMLGYLGWRRKKKPTALAA